MALLSYNILQTAETNFVKYKLILAGWILYMHLHMCHSLAAAAVTAFIVVVVVTTTATSATAKQTNNYSQPRHSIDSIQHDRREMYTYECVESVWVNNFRMIA